MSSTTTALTNLNAVNITPAVSALVVEGGAMRSVFSSGLLDGFLQQSFNPFDFYLGVSAGAANLAFYKAAAAGRSLQVFLDIADSRQFISYRRFFSGGHLLDLDWLFNTYFDSSTLDLQAAFDQFRPLYIGVTDVSSGDAVYLKASAENFSGIIKASSALPLVYRTFPEIDNKRMTDGGVADSIPVQQAITLGARNILVIRARHKDYLKKDTLSHRLIRWKLRQHPQLKKVMQQRVIKHKETIELIRKPPAGITILEVCPPQNFSIGRFSRDHHRLKQGYQEGLTLADDTIRRWRSMCG